MTNPNDPAFSEMVLNKGQTFEQYDRTPVGLSKREYFVGLIMQGISANPNFNSKDAIIVNGKKASLTEAAVLAADALIEELNRKPK